MGRSATRVTRLLPGILLCVAVAAAALGLQGIESLLAGRALVEALVIAIVLGALVRTLWTPGERWLPGIDFSARRLLEVAVMALGATISLRTLAGQGVLLGLAIVAVVVVAIGSSYAICRGLALKPRIALLIACGNSICGNSAIVAVAPVIGANSEEVASSIAYTALLGVAIVLGLPLTIHVLGLDHAQYGVLAGLTVYAVPQVLAATVAVSSASVQIGTLVKLMRVLMLGPVLLLLSLGNHSRANFRVSRLVPWFIVGFLALAAMNSLGLIPKPVQGPLFPATDLLTVIAMAALGLSTDLRAVARAGTRVTLGVTLSLAVLIAISLLVVKTLGLA